MGDAPAEQAPPDQVSNDLDDELEALQEHSTYLPSRGRRNTNILTVKALRQMRAIQTSTILASKSSESMLAKLRPPPTKRLQADDTNPLHLSILDTAQKQAAHKQDCLYRVCAGITTFKVRDPDPYAADDGNVVGVRIEAFQGGRYVRPYYVFLNRPYRDKGILRVHRHTVPPCIPLNALAERWLATPRTDGEPLKKKQSLQQFVRRLRLQITAYHNRVAVIAGMRKVFGLEGGKGDKGKQRESGVGDVSAADAEARQVRLEFLDGRVGRAVMDDKGEVMKCVVVGEEGRDRETEGKLMGGDKRVEGMADRLLA